MNAKVITDIYLSSVTPLLHTAEEVLWGWQQTFTCPVSPHCCMQLRSCEGNNRHLPVHPGLSKIHSWHLVGVTRHLPVHSDLAKIHSWGLADLTKHTQSCNWQLQLLSYYHLELFQGMRVRRKFQHHHVCVCVQGRQKLARFNAREFATLVMDILNDARLRQTGTMSPIQTPKEPGERTQQQLLVWNHLLSNCCWWKMTYWVTVVDEKSPTE